MTSLTFFFFFIPLLVIILLLVNLLLATRNPYAEKNSAFECGFHSFLGQNRSEFNISFFIFALLFLLFDLEILLVYPYIVSSYVNEQFGLSLMLVFFILLTLGFVFELGKNALSIDSRQVKPGQNLIGSANSNTKPDLTIFNTYDFVIGLYKNFVFYILSEQFILLLLKTLLYLVLWHVSDTYPFPFIKVVHAMSFDQPRDKGKGKKWEDYPKQSRDKGKGKKWEDYPEPEPSSDSGYTEYSSEWHSDDSNYTRNEKFKIKRWEAASHREHLISLLSEKPSLHMVNLIEEHLAKHNALFKDNKKYQDMDISLKYTKEERILMGERFINNRDKNAELLKELIKNYPILINDLHNNPGLGTSFYDRKRKWPSDCWDNTGESSKKNK